MKKLILIVALLCFGPVFAQAQEEPLTVDLAQDHVGITAGFNGANLVLFGVKEEDGDIAVVIRGPEKTAVVRRKKHVMGVWFNARGMKFRNVPAYYDYALSKSEVDLAEVETLKINGIGLNALRFEPATRRKNPKNLENFQEALIRNKQREGLFPLHARKIQFLSDNFFKASFHMPSNVPTGRYEIQSFLIRDGAVIQRRVTELTVGQVGIEASLYKFAHERSLAYALLCVAIAVMAGWVVNAVGRRA